MQACVNVPDVPSQCACANMLVCDLNANVCQHTWCNFNACVCQDPFWHQVCVREYTWWELNMCVHSSYSIFAHVKGFRDSVLDGVLNLWQHRPEQCLYESCARQKSTATLETDSLLFLHPTAVALWSKFFQRHLRSTRAFLKRFLTNASQAECYVWVRRSSWLLQAVHSSILVSLCVSVQMVSVP